MTQVLAKTRNFGETGKNQKQTCALSRKEPLSWVGLGDDVDAVQEKQLAKWDPILGDQLSFWTG